MGLIITWILTTFRSNPSMTDESENQHAYTNEEVVNWVTAQVQATKESGAILPAWMIAAFEDARKTSTDVEVADTTLYVDTLEVKAINQDNHFNSELVYCKVCSFCVSYSDLLWWLTSS